MKVTHYIISLLLILSVNGWSETVSLTVLQTADIHCHLTGKHGGWLNLATAIKQAQKKAGGTENSLLIDCGDTIQGTYIGRLSNGMVAIEALNVLNYDIWVIGNHDFDFGLNNLALLINKCQAAPLAANLKLNPPVKAIKPWVLIHKKNIKIAVIGLTSPNLERWLWGKSLIGISPLNYQAVLADIMPSIMKSHPDLIILAVHHGDYPMRKTPENDLNKLAELYPQIDLILGGHTHQDVAGKRIGVNSWFVQAGMHGQSLAKIDLEIDLTAHNVKNIKSCLIKTAKYPPDPVLKKRLQPWLSAYYKNRKRVVGSTKTPLKPLVDKKLNASLNELLSRAIAEAGNTEMAFHASSRFAKKLKGNITENNLFRLIPYEDTVGVLQLTEDELKAVIKEQMRLKHKGRFQAPFGLYATVDKKGNIVGNLKQADQSPFVKNKRYRVAFNSYILAGGGNRFPYLKNLAKKQTSKSYDSGISVRQALKSYIKAHSPVVIKETQWIKRWPK